MVSAQESVLTPEEIQQYEDDLGIVLVKADWTNYDEDITQALQQFGKNSIPFYVLYTKDKETPYVYFPEILTAGIVLDTLNKSENLLQYSTNIMILNWTGG